MTDPTQAEILAMTDRTQDYIDRLHAFAQAEADKAEIPASIAIPAVLAWALSIAKLAGIEIVPLTLEVDIDDPASGESIH